MNSNGRRQYHLKNYLLVIFKVDKFCRWQNLRFAHPCATRGEGKWLMKTRRLIMSTIS